MNSAKHSEEDSEDLKKKALLVTHPLLLTLRVAARRPRQETREGNMSADSEEAMSEAPLSHQNFLTSLSIVAHTVLLGVQAATLPPALRRAAFKQCWPCWRVSLERR